MPFNSTIEPVEAYHNQQVGFYSCSPCSWLCSYPSILSYTGAHMKSSLWRTSVCHPREVTSWLELKVLWRYRQSVCRGQGTEAVYNYIVITIIMFNSPIPCLSLRTISQNNKSVNHIYHDSTKASICTCINHRIVIHDQRRDGYRGCWIIEFYQIAML